MEAEGSILLAEDDEELSSMMRQFFARSGFIAESVNNGRDAIRKALEPGFDLVILDVMMPILDGFEVLHQIRKRSAIPVIMLTAGTSQPDRIDGLNTGADDYLPVTAFSALSSQQVTPLLARRVSHSCSGAVMSVREGARVPDFRALWKSNIQGRPNCVYLAPIEAPVRLSKLLLQNEAKNGKPKSRGTNRISEADALFHLVAEVGVEPTR
jgi:CheY-like chemotaxis protein